MICWMDFVLDDVCGPLLDEELVRDAIVTVCRGKRVGGSSVMEDADEAKAVPIQETGQEQRLARMAGHSSLDSHSPTGTEAGRSGQSHSRHREEA